MSSFRAFKYRGINKFLIDSLVNSSIYFASRDALNDPFDSRIDIQTLINGLLEESLAEEARTAIQLIQNDATFFQKFEAGYRDFGICSFSTELSNTLMWSHYADHHRGVAIHYDFPISFLDNPDEILGVAPVDYEGNSVSDWIREQATLFHTNHFEFVTELLKRVLTAKAPAWSYEREGRIIRPKTGSYPVPRSTLKGITFGLRMEQADENLIRSIAAKYFEGIQFSRVVRTGSDFGIDVEDVA